MNKSIQINIYLQGFSGHWFFKHTERDELLRAIENQSLYVSEGWGHRGEFMPIISMDFAQIPVVTWEYVDQALVNELQVMWRKTDDA